MAKNSIRDFDNTAGNNTDIQSVDIAENCAPSGINNAIRELMADMADVNDGTVALVSPAMDSADINGGTIDGATIGGTTPAAGTFTTGDFNTSLNVDGTITSDGLRVDGEIAVNTAIKSWDASTDAVQFQSGSLWNFSTSQLNLDQNVYYNGAYKYLNTGAASEYSQASGAHFFKVASSGSADADISFTTALTVANSANVGIGTSSPAYKLDVASAVIQFGDSTDAFAQYKSSAGNWHVGANSSNAFAFYSGTYGSGTERLRLNSTGNLLLRQTSDAVYDTNGAGSVASYYGAQFSSAQSTATKTILGNAADGNYMGSATNNSSGNAIINGYVRAVSTVQTAGSEEGILTFATKPSGSSATERMRIDSSGNVGINETNPSFKLDVANVGGDAIRINAGADFSGLRLTSTAGEWAIRTSVADQLFFYDVSASQTRMTLDSSGNLLVGTTDTTLYANTSGEGFSVVNSELGVAKSTTCAYFNRMGSNGTTVKFFNRGGNVGDISTTSTSTSYNTSSDYRLKENVTDITDGIERVKQLNPSRFNFIADADTTVDGFLAHEVYDIVPEAVSGEKDAMQDEEYEVTPAVLDDDGNVVTEAVMGTRSVPDYQGIDQSKLVPLLTAALQEAIGKIETLEAKVTALENA